MVDLLIVVSCVFLTAAVGAAVGYYRNLVRIREKYEKAKEAFNDMLLSFSRELKRTTDSLQTISYKVEAASANGSDALKAVKELESRLKLLEDKAKTLFADKERLFTRLSDVEKQTSDITEAHKEVLAKISVIEERTQKMPSPSELGVETAIPIKREKALAQLTETELAVLGMLVAEGPKTAPEIKGRIRLSREHTARLMKKLYEEGYLERDSSKIPFKYCVKKEMEKFLKRAETETS
ncbi:MAG: helix-turn-helix domain-containing protein [Candidatus Bathyarchaeia archaeon]